MRAPIDSYLAQSFRQKRAASVDSIREELGGGEAGGAHPDLLDYIQSPRRHGDTDIRHPEGDPGIRG